jgi:hypothetical protein
MTTVGSGNISGFHYSKANCEVLIREFFEREGYEIDKYNIPFPLARKLAVEIRNEAWLKEFFNKTISLGDSDVDVLLDNEYITLVGEIKKEKR